jgi:ferredoxin
VNADFVPVALKAGLVNYPPNDEEGRLYREIGRSKILPQGICVINSACKVLAWADMFDDEKSVLAFLDHCSQRFAQFPGAQKPFPAERYPKYPSEKGPDVQDNGKAPVIVERHAKGKSCPAKPPVQHGTIDARLFGRALDKDGKPVADTLRQDFYVEDRFDAPVAMQEALAKALKVAGSDRFRLADDLARLLASHAFLGELDVNPVVSNNGSKCDLKQCEFWARSALGPDDDRVRVRIEGKSEARGVQSGDEHGLEGPLWQHEVKLTWEGIIELKKDRISRLLLVARGSEKLKRRHVPLEVAGQPGVILLWASRAPDLSCGVCYGIMGEPVPGDDTGDVEVAPQETTVAQVPPDQQRKDVVNALGMPFIVFREKVLEELKVADEPKAKLLQHLMEQIMETGPFLDSLAQAGEEREQKLEEHRKKAREKLARVLTETLKTEQLKRLRQIELQQEGAFALGQAELVKELRITDQQRQQFVAITQELQKRVQPLVKEAQSGGKPEEIRPKIIKIRDECAKKLEAVLTEAQNKQWKAMLGKPFDLRD